MEGDRGKGWKTCQSTFDLLLISQLVPPRWCEFQFIKAMVTDKMQACEQFAKEQGWKV